MNDHHEFSGSDIRELIEYRSIAEESGIDKKQAEESKFQTSDKSDDEGWVEIWYTKDELMEIAREELEESKRIDKVAIKTTLEAIRDKQ